VLIDSHRPSPPDPGASISCLVQILRGEYFFVYSNARSGWQGGSLLDDYTRFMAQGSEENETCGGQATLAPDLPNRWSI